MKKQTKKFKPKPGQVDFTHIRWAPVVNCVVKCRGKILLVQRSKELKFYPGVWNGASGFLDDHKSLKEKVEEELREELGIPKSKIKKITLGEIFDQEDAKHKKTWIVHPVLVEVSTDKVKLDFEAEDFQWVTFREARKKKLMSGFGIVLDKVEKISQL